MAIDVNDILSNYLMGLAEDKPKVLAQPPSEVTPAPAEVAPTPAPEEAPAVSEEPLPYVLKKVAGPPTAKEAEYGLGPEAELAVADQAPPEKPKDVLNEHIMNLLKAQTEKKGKADELVTEALYKSQGYSKNPETGEWQAPTGMAAWGRNLSDAQRHGINTAVSGLNTNVKNLVTASKYAQPWEAPKGEVLKEQLPQAVQMGKALNEIEADKRNSLVGISQMMKQVRENTNAERMNDPSSAESVAAQEMVKKFDEKTYQRIAAASPGGKPTAAALDQYVKLLAGSDTAVKRIEAAAASKGEDRKLRQKLQDERLADQAKGRELAQKRFDKMFEYKMDANGVKQVADLDNKLNPMVGLAKTYETLGSSYEKIKDNDQAKNILFGPQAVIRNLWKPVRDAAGQIISVQIDPEEQARVEEKLQSIPDESLRDNVLSFYQARNQAIANYVLSISGKASTDAERAFLAQAVGMSPAASQSEFEQGADGLARLSKARIDSAKAPYVGKKPGTPGAGVWEAYTAGVGDIESPFNPIAKSKKGTSTKVEQNADEKAQELLKRGGQ